MKKLISLLSLILIIAMLFGFSVSAESGDSFTHINEPDGNEITVLSREMYTPTAYITASSLGLSEAFGEMTDICFDSSGRVYILCASRLIALNSDYSLKREYVITDENEQPVDFTGAKGVFVDKNNDIYIADTAKGRVIIADTSGRVKEIWEIPESELIPEDFVYQPASITRDEQGYTYILSNGCYYGALIYSPEGEFKGFYGANTVEASALDTLEFIWDKLTGNDIKRAATIKKLPYSFVDFSLDSDNYLIVCTGSTDGISSGKGQIRKISPGGSDILYASSKSGDSMLSSAINFLENKTVTKNNKFFPQNIVSIDVDNSGFIYALDKTYGLIYVYDDTCNLLGSFGGGFGKGDKLGLFTVAESIAVSNDSILVADSAAKAITVYKSTEYGKLLKTAQTFYIKGQYKEAEPYWEKVISQDRGNQLAYKGMAMIKYYDGEYSEALEYAEKGLDYAVYDLAYQSILKDFLKSNFIVIAIAAVLAAAGLIGLLIYLKRKRRAVIKNPALNTTIGVVVHPFDSFNDIKYKKKGSYLIASVIVLLFFVSTALNDAFSGFLFSGYSPQSYNIFYTFAKTVCLIALWSVSNWLVCVLFSGKGKLGEIFITSSYSLILIVIYKFARLFLSYLLPLSGMMAMEGIYTAILIYTFFILSVAMMTVHEYGFFKFIATGLLSLFGMLLVVFILFMVIIQIQQFGIFISSIFMEIVYR